MRGSTRAARAVALATVGSLILAGAADARGGPPGNLGNGLGRLLAPPAARAAIRLDQNVAGDPRQGGARARRRLRRRRQRAVGRPAAERGSGLKVLDQSAEHKILEGYVAVSDVKALAATPGVASVSQALKPFTKVGAATSQGVQAQRVDRVRGGIDGRGITVGALSDSFDTATETIAGDPLTIHAADDIKSGDLPREGVTVLQDDPSPGSTDEGRAMLQIVHDVAPAREGVLRHRGRRRAELRQQHPRAGRQERPVQGRRRRRRRRLLRRAVLRRRRHQRRGRRRRRAGRPLLLLGRQRLGAAGLPAPLRIIAPSRPDDTSNINLDGVDPNLYQGGFQDFDPGPGVDVAMDQALGFDGDEAGVGILDLQWDDPNDPNGAIVAPDPKVHVDGADHRGRPGRVDPVRRHGR